MERPLYFTVAESAKGIGLGDYLQTDGFTYQVVPIKTATKSGFEVGRIDTETLYDNLMNNYKYGNVKDPRAYADYFIQTNFNSVRIRNQFAQLGKTGDRGGYHSRN